MSKKFIITVSMLIALLAACTSPEKKGNSKVIRVIKSIDGELVIPRSANKIRIMPFYSTIKDKSVSEKLLIRIRKKISMDGRLAVVNGKNSADLRLDGRVRGFQIQPIKFGEHGRPIKKRMRIIVSVRLMDMKSRKTIFFDREIQSFKMFSDFMPPIKTEIEVVEDVIEDLAERISRKIITGWYTDKMTRSERGK